MGFPQFNLTMLQLVAPAANMTKAEYKAAYGIDLDAVNIKAFKLVLFGGEKYAIDQIKEVEDGIEIYFNGRIMSITDIVQVSNEVYDVANATPVYCHPILLYSSNAKNRVMMLIFNNSSEAYTLQTLFNFITSSDDFRGMLSGIYAGEQAFYITRSASSVAVTYHDDSATSGVNSATLDYSAFSTAFPSIADTIHKIN